MNVFVISQACYDTTTCLWKGLVTLISLQKINTLKKQKDTERQVNAAEHLAAEETDISCWCWPELTSLPSYVRDTLILFKGTVRVIRVACLSDFRERVGVRDSNKTLIHGLICEQFCQSHTNRFSSAIVDNNENNKYIDPTLQ